MDELTFPLKKKKSKSRSEAHKNQLDIRTQIGARYHTIDKSGKLPFVVLFGLCRRLSASDVDPRPLTLCINGTALDVPYAIVNGLITLSVQDAPDREIFHAAQDAIKQFQAEPTQEPTYVTLSSPVHRPGKWKKELTLFEYEVKPETGLAAILKAGVTYDMRLSEQDLGVKWYAYGDREQVLEDQEDGWEFLSGATSFFSCPSHGRVLFKVVESLSWPPPVKISMRLSSASGGDETGSDSTILEIGAINTGIQDISVQTRGLQNYLQRWGIWQPKDSDTERQRRVLDVLNMPYSANNFLRVVDADTESVVREPRPFSGCIGLTNGKVKVDRRPGQESLVTLRSGEPVIREVDITKPLESLPNGRYLIQLVPRGAWWCSGRVDDIIEEGGTRVAHHLWTTRNPPLMLESDDQIELRVEDGKAVLPKYDAISLSGGDV